MKKIILSVAVAAMALTTTASALENIKVTGQAKLWYETNDKGDNSMLNKDNSVAASTFALGVTGKQGNVSFGTKIIDSSSMTTLGGARDNSQDDGLTVSEMYIAVPLSSKTTVKIGKQQIQTPFAFSENWMAVPNTFNAALVINKSIKNLTLVGAYVAQGNTSNALGNDTGGGFKVAANGEFTGYAAGNDVFAVIGHYKNAGLSVNAYAYEWSTIAKAYWLDASAKLGPVALKGIAAAVSPVNSATDDTTALALNAAGKVGSVSLSGAVSHVEGEVGSIPIGNTATNFKKTKLPTAGVYTDGRYVAQPGSTAIKIKAVTKLAGAKVIVQAVQNSNSKTAYAKLETTELNLIVIKKIGDFKFKGILLNRSFDDDKTDKAAGGNHFRLITSVSF